MADFDPDAFLAETQDIPVRNMYYGPIAGEHTRATMFGPQGNRLGPNDVAASPNLGLPYGTVLADQAGHVGRVADASYFTPGRPTSNTIEWRNRKADGRSSIHRIDTSGFDPDEFLAGDKASPAPESVPAPTLAQEVGPPATDARTQHLIDSSHIGSQRDLEDIAASLPGFRQSQEAASQYDTRDKFTAGIGNNLTPIANHPLQSAYDMFVPTKENTLEPLKQMFTDPAKAFSRDVPIGSQEWYNELIGNLGLVLPGAAGGIRGKFALRRTASTPLRDATDLATTKAEPLPQPSEMSSPEAPLDKAIREQQAQAELDAMSSELQRQRQASEVLSPLPPLKRTEVAPTIKGSTYPDPFGTEETPVAFSLINDVGGVLSKSTARKLGKLADNADLWDSAPEKLSNPRHNTIYSAKGVMPDEAAQALYDQGLINEPASGAMWRAIELESKTSRNVMAQGKVPAVKLEENVPQANRELGQAAPLPVDIMPNAATLPDVRGLAETPLRPEQEPARGAETTSPAPGLRQNEGNTERPDDANVRDSSGLARPKAPGASSEAGRNPDAAALGVTGVSRAARDAAGEVERTPAAVLSVEDHVQNGQRLERQGAIADIAVRDAIAKGSFSRDATDLAIKRDADLTKAARVARRAADDNPMLSAAADAAEKAQQEWEDRAIRPIRGQFADTGMSLQTAIDLDTGSYIDYAKAFRKQNGRAPTAPEAAKLQQATRSARKLSDANSADIARVEKAAKPKRIMKLDELRESLAKSRDALFKDCIV